MSNWNYRIIEYIDGGYGVHEVYYNEDGKPDGYTECAVTFGGEGLEEVVASLQLALKDITEKEVLKEGEFHTAMS